MSGIDIGPKIGIEGEKQFKDAIKAVNSQIKTTASSLKVLAAESEKSEDKAKNLSDRQKALGESLDANKTKIKTLTAQYDRQKSKLDELDTALEKARKENGEGSEEAVKAENAYSKQAKAVSDLETQINTAKVQIANISGELETNAVKLQEARSRAIKYGDAMKAAGDKISGIGTKISQAGGALTLGITTPLVAAGTASVKFATDAETSFAKVSTIADTSVLSMDKIKAGALEMSNTTGVAVTDVNEALYQTISATGDTANALGYTTIAAKAAKGGFTDTATAVDGLTTIMNSYGLKGSEAMQMVSDQMLMAQNYGKTTFGELASSMGQVVPIASQLNIGTDTLLATMATLTKNGIGTSQAVTGMKAALSNIIKPSSEAADAAAVLGLDFSAAALQSKGFAGIMGDVKSALENAAPEYANLVGHLEETKDKMADLEDAGQKNTAQYKALQKESKATEKSLETIAGAADSPIAGFSTLFGSVEGLNSMLVLASKTGGKDFEGAMQAMADSSGATQSAFDKMDSTPAAQMQKELNKLKNTGIETGNKLLPIVTKAVEGAGKLLDAYNNLDDGTKDLILRTAGIAAAAGPALKITGTATKGIGKLTSGVGGLVKDMGKLSSAKKAAQAIGEVGSKSVKSVEGVSGFSKVLFKLGSPGGIALLAAGALVGVGAAFLKARDDAIKADISAHFGNVKLSAEEVEDVAKRLTTTDWTVKIGAVVEAKAKLEQAEKDLEGSIETLNTLDWKVQVGLVLTEEETTAYQSAIDSFAKSAQEYVSQQGYTVSLALDATLGKDTTAGEGLAAFSNNYFASAESQLQDLGERLAEKVNHSFEDGTFAENRIEIQKIVDQMNGILQEIQDAEHAAKLDNMKIEFSTEGLGIDEESFDKLNEKISENTQELLDDSKEAQVTALTSVNLMYKDMTDSGIPEEFAQKVREDAKLKIEQSTLEKQGDAINIGFDFAFGAVSENYSTAVGQAKGDVKNTTEEFASTLGDALKGVDAEFIHWTDDFERTITPLSGSAQETVSTMLESLQPQKEALQTIADNCLAAGKSVPESVKQGLSDIAQWESMVGNVDGMYTLLAQQISTNPEQLKAVKEAAANGKKIPEELGKAISMYTGIPFDAATGMFGKIQQGTELSAEEVSDYLNKVGAGLDETLAGSIASQYGLIKKNGKYMVDQAAQGVKKNTPVFEKASGDMAQSGVNKMEGISSSAVLTPPSMATPYWTPAASQGLGDVQSFLNSHPLVATLTVNTINAADALSQIGLGVIPHADGGIFTTPHIGLIAEESPGEALVPLARSRRREAVAILEKTAEIIGYDSYAYAAGAGRSLGASRAKPQKSPAPKQTVYRFEEGAIQNEIHTQATDPEKIYRVVSRRMEQDVKRMVKGHGGI